MTPINPLGIGEISSRNSIPENSGNLWKPWEPYVAELYEPSYHLESSQGTSDTLGTLVNFISFLLNLDSVKNCVCKTQPKDNEHG